MRLSPVTLLVPLLLSAAAPARAADGPAPLPDAARRPYLQNYKDFALAACIAEAYKAEPKAAEDASASAGGVFTWSSFDAEESGGRLPALIARTLDQTYGSFQGPAIRLDLMKCLDMYHGRELDDLARRTVAHPAMTYEEEYPEDR